MSEFQPANSSGDFRVLLVSPLPPPEGGIANWTRLVLTEAGRRYGLTVDQIDIAPRWRDVNDMRPLMRSLGGGLQGIRDCIRVYHRLRQRRHDCIHLSTSGSLAVIRDLVVLALAKRYGVRSVYHIRVGRLPDSVASNAREWRLMRWAMRMAHSVIVLDARTERALSESLPEVNVVLVPNCIDTRKWMPTEQLDRSDRIPRIVYVGWVKPEKGLRELVAAWAAMEAPRPFLDIVGPCTESFRAELLSIVKDSDPHDKLRFHGGVTHEDAITHMRAADIVVLPSYTEGFPNVVLEAMALGKAIVATRVGAIPEMLEGKAPHCGICVEPRDTQGLQLALTRALNDREQRVHLGQLARKTVEERYSLQSVMDRYVSIWRGSITNTDEIGVVFNSSSRN